MYVCVCVCVFVCILFLIFIDHRNGEAIRIHNEGTMACIILFSNNFFWEEPVLCVCVCLHAHLFIYYLPLCVCLCACHFSLSICLFICTRIHYLISQRIFVLSTKKLMYKVRYVYSLFCIVYPLAISTLPSNSLSLTSQIQARISKCCHY